MGILSVYAKLPSPNRPMLLHLSHLMDLACQFQWETIRAYHSHALQAIEQGSTIWGSDFSRFQTGLLLHSLELAAMAQPTWPAVGCKKVDKESVCKDWNFCMPHYLP